MLQIYILDDGSAKGALPDVTALEEDSESENDGSDAGSASDAASPDESDGSHAGRRQRRKLNGDAEEYARRRERKRRAQLEVDAYYTQSGHGASAAALMYQLAMQLSKDSNRLLWCGE